METDTFNYTVKREELGKATNFSSADPTMVAYLPDLAHDKMRKFNSAEIHEPRDPNFGVFSNIPKISESMVNTERKSTNDRKMYHFEGGWPLEVEDITDPRKRKNYIKKKIEKSQTDNTTERFLPCLNNMANTVKGIMRENN